ncbi:UNVERIFIED_CONTAM: hypothetical protein HDU68_011255 [Siphonaria sp. JEL0065]|nr:hypothetical protein HDU68_011255 [Siphonaria sp. JEL0065]
MRSRSQSSTGPNGNKEAGAGGAGGYVPERGGVAGGGNGSNLGGLSFLNIRKRIGSKDKKGSPNALQVQVSAGPGFISASSASANASANSATTSAAEHSPASSNAPSSAASSASRSRNVSAAPNVTNIQQPVVLVPQMSFAEFRLTDKRQQKQRRCLFALQKLAAKFKAEGSANLWKHGPRESAAGGVVNKFKRISQTANNSKTLAPGPSDSMQNVPTIHLPSYFMAAVGLGLENVVRGMVKVLT